MVFSESKLFNKFFSKYISSPRIRCLKLYENLFLWERSVKCSLKNKPPTKQTKKKRRKGDCTLQSYTILYPGFLNFLFSPLTYAFHSMSLAFGFEEPKISGPDWAQTFPMQRDTGLLSGFS